MPHSKTQLKLLVRKGPLSDQDWLDLVQARRDIIKPHLDSFTFSELGSLACLRSEISHTHRLQDDISTSTGDERFSIKSQGIFRVQAWKDVERKDKTGYQCRPGGINCPDGTMHIWGLVRSGHWVFVTVQFVGESGYKERGYERAKSIEITEVDLPVMLTKTKVTPQQVWAELGQAIMAWEERRRWLHNQSLNLAHMVKMEELVLSLISEEA